MSATDNRFPRSVYSTGEEPDPRFSLANERTFLAWIRTSLAFVAAGVAVEALELGIRTELRFLASITLLLLGVLCAVQAWTGWVRSERAMRRQTRLPGPTPAPALIGGLILAAVLISVGLFL